ncbi:MAG: hypothetical protein M0P12_00540 [Paludibacteraceae bacterium]|jgi:hypothetical protein|nr:hypothetical protein [Paludibacteraceae bacterium]
MSNQKQITIADLIKHLQKMPQDQLLWWYHDESGTYGQYSEMPGKIEDIQWSEKWKTWRYFSKTGSGEKKKVFVI